MWVIKYHWHFPDIGPEEGIVAGFTSEEKAQTYLKAARLKTRAGDNRKFKQKSPLAMYDDAWVEWDDGYIIDPEINF